MTELPTMTLLLALAISFFGCIAASSLYARRPRIVYAALAAFAALVYLAAYLTYLVAP